MADVPRRRITVHEFARALHDAGILDDTDYAHARRIVIDANGPSKTVMVYVERFADERWLNVHLGLTGIEVTVPGHGGEGGDAPGNS